MPGFSVIHYLEFAQIHIHLVSDTINYLILCLNLLLLPSIFPSIRVFSNESALHTRRTKHWSFSFSISHIQGWFPLELTLLITSHSKGLLRVFSSTTIQKHQFFGDQTNICCSLTQSYPTLCSPMKCSTPGFPVLQHLPELAQTHVHWVSDAIESLHHLLSPFFPAFNLSLLSIFPSIRERFAKESVPFHQVTKVLELQL